ncbi:MAG: hypothetical protein ABII74_00330, partial [Elusimicrobiota bacterium]
MMKKEIILICCIFTLFTHKFAAADDGLSSFCRHLPPSFPGILSVSQERALEQRADQIIEINDALIQKTIQANGGNYFHQGKSKILIFNHKIYKDFTIRVIKGN